MALRALMLRRSIDNKKKELEQLRGKEAAFKKRETELEAAIAEVTEATDEEQQKAVEEEVAKYEAEKSAFDKAKDECAAAIDRLEEELKGIEEAAPTEEPTTEETAIIEETERSKRTRMININIRALPKEQRVFDALPMQTRQEIVARQDVKNFLKELRAMKGGAQRAVSGADLTIPIVFLDLISENMFRYSKLLNRIRVRNVRGEARQTIAGTVPEAIWTEMCAAINELEFVFNQVTVDGYKVAGFVPVCNSILEDNDINLASWIVEMLSESIGLAEDKAILYGTGIKMPMGIVSRLAQTAKPSDYPANAPTWTDLHTTNIQKIDSTLTGAAFWAALTVATGNAYSLYARGEKFWAMNSKTYNLLKSKVITFTATGDIAAGVFATLPIITGDVDILEFIPDGDIIGGYGDLYLWVNRGEIQIDADRSVQFIQDNTVFRGKARADGTPVIPQSFVALNINGSEVTTSMTFAADTANDALLQSLTVGSETLTPTFDPAVMAYTITAAAATDKIEATAAQAQAKIELNLNGKNLNNGGTATWTSGSNTLTVTVRNGNAVRVYTLTVTKS
ncbi:MAG: phage major capsid protein [Christensenellales bacterium]